MGVLTVLPKEHWSFRDVLYIILGTKLKKKNKNSKRITWVLDHECKSLVNLRRYLVKIKMVGMHAQFPVRAANIALYCIFSMKGDP